jgi:hypothetical protein
LVGALLVGEDEVDADPVSIVFAIRLVSQDSLSLDELNKMLQLRGLNPQAFVGANLLRSSRRQYKPVSANRRGAEIAQRGKIPPRRARTAPPTGTGMTCSNGVRAWSQPSSCAPETKPIRRYGGR